MAEPTTEAREDVLESQDSFESGKVEPHDFAPTHVEADFLRELGARRIAFLVADFWRSRSSDGQTVVYCSLIFDSRALRAVRTLARALGGDAELQEGRLSFKGPLRRFSHELEADFGLLPLELELHAARSRELAPGLEVPFLDRARFESLHLPLAKQRLPMLQLPKPPDALTGSSYILARLLAGPERTDALLLDRHGQPFVLKDYRYTGRPPCFGDRVAVTDARALRVLRRSVTTPRTLARDTGPDSCRAIRRDDALMRAIFHDELLERARAVLRARMPSDEPAT